METFEEYLKEARNEFCAKINEQEWNIELRTACESFIIAYDQVMYKYVDNTDVNRVELVSKENGREKAVKTNDITLSFQDDGKTLKIFYGYGKLDNLKHFSK
jgi:hypothetical protein